jgi:hypothetical protein
MTARPATSSTRDTAMLPACSAPHAAANASASQPSSHATASRVHVA